MSNRDKELVQVVCHDCGKPFNVTFGQFRRYKINEHEWRCKECRYKHQAVISKEKWNNMPTDKKNKIVADLHNNRDKYFANLSEEDKKKISDRAKDQWKNMSDEDRSKVSARVSAQFKKYFSEMSEEERNRFNKRCKEQAVNFWNNATKEQRKQHSDHLKAYHASLSDEEKMVLCQKISITNKNNYKNLSQEEKDKQKQRVINWYKSLTPDEWNKWRYKISRTHNENFDKINTNPNKNELMFINILKLNSIDYIWQWSNINKHSDFDHLFPCNPVTGSKFVSPYHEWDFKLHTLSGDVLVDIDGSVHSKDRAKFEINGVYKKYLVSDYIQFNDSKRPYQTDGLPSYVVLCYNDNLTYDTPVKNICNNEIISFKEFITLISFMNMNDKEQKLLIKNN